MLRQLLQEAQLPEIEKLLADKTIPYDQFIEKLDQYISDPKVKTMLHNGLKDGSIHDDRITASVTNISVRRLIPTQNEIDMSKSLKFIMNTDTDTIARCIEDNPVVIKIPIVTLNGRYIIDGHHRWSEVYCANSHAKMKCYNFTSNIKPIDMLKKIQIAIAADIGTVPTANVQGLNLMTTPLDKIVSHIIDNITDSAVALYNRYYNLNDSDLKKSVAVDVMLPNIEFMRRYNKPIPNAPSRDVMPQTDEADNSLKLLVKGMANINPPYHK